MNMEVSFMDHVRHSLMIDRNKDVIIDKLLNLTLEIICLLTGEDYVVVRKSGEKMGCQASDVGSEERDLFTAGSPPSPVTEKNPTRRIPETARKRRRDAEKLPIKSEDAQISAWDYMTERKDSMALGAREPRGSTDSASIQRILEASVNGRQDSTDPISSDLSGQCSALLCGDGGGLYTIYPYCCFISTGSPYRKCRSPLCSQEYQAESPGDGMFLCKEEEDAAIPDDIGSGEDDSTDHPEQCLNPVSSEDFTEEDTELVTQEYQSDVGDKIFHPQCKEEVASDYTSSGPAISSLDAVVIRQCSQTQEHFPNHSDPATFQTSLGADSLFSCSICGVNFSSEMTFAAHQRFHTEDKSYDCSYCGKSFNQRSRLLSHKRKHTGEKPFSCPVCGRCFAERSALVTHQRIHSGEKPFNCTECARSFVQRSSLVKHQRIHTGERPFVCAQCGRCFSQSSNLVRHQRILHQFL